MPGHLDPVRLFNAGKSHIGVYSSPLDAGVAAAAYAAELMKAANAKHGRIRIIAATGNSQLPLVEALIQEDVDWKAVELFHMDEYAGIRAGHPSSFRHWIKNRIADRVHPRVTHYLDGDERDLQKEADRYSDLLAQAPIDLAFVGFGENGHIAFNDPSVADFKDSAMVKIVSLDQACRRQQVGEGHFPDLDSVPKQAITVTCSGLFRAKNWICCVPESRKSHAVQCALEGPISEESPASLVRRHPNAHVYLDRDSASQLTPADQITN